MTSAIKFVGANRYLKTNGKARAQSRLEDELERIKKRVGMGEEVRVLWIPGAEKYREGKKLEEEVRGDTILIYAIEEDEALELLRHGFAEWLLDQHTRKYRLLVNKLIELFEQIQYGDKETIVEAIAKLITQTRNTKQNLQN